MARESKAPSASQSEATSDASPNLPANWDNLSSEEKEQILLSMHEAGISLLKIWRLGYEWGQPHA